MEVTGERTGWEKFCFEGGTLLLMCVGTVAITAVVDKILQACNVAYEKRMTAANFSCVGGLIVSVPFAAVLSHIITKKCFASRDEASAATSEESAAPSSPAPTPTVVPEKPPLACH